MIGTGSYTQEPGSNPLARRDCAVGQPWMPDWDEIPAGQVAFYLVSGNAAGLKGSLGTNSAGDERPNANPLPLTIPAQRGAATSAPATPRPRPRTRMLSDSATSSSIV